MKADCKRSESNRVCFTHITGSAYKANFVQTLNAQYQVKEKEARKISTRDPFPRKGKTIENCSVMIM